MDKEQRLRKFNLASKIQSVYIMHYLSGKYQNILDLCAGDGEITVKLSKLGERIFALDNDPKRIDRIFKLVKKNNIKNVTLNYCSAEVLPYKTSMFDVIVCNSALEHIDNYQIVIKEIQRVLRPNGILIITVPNNNMQFGSRFTFFWSLIIKLPLKVKKRICCNTELSFSNDINAIKEYFKFFFKHVVGFTPEKIINEFKIFRIIEVRYYMNLIGALCHDSAYFFKFCNTKVFLYFSLLVCYLEFLIIRKTKGKGIIMICQNIK